MLNLLKGEMVVYKEKDTESSSETTLFQMRGKEDSNTRTIECFDVSSSSLNSLDIFFLRTAKDLYIWYGSLATEKLRNKANNVANLLKKSQKIMSFEEGKESQAFWDLLGGKDDYPSIKDKNRIRFWVCENVNKTYKCYEQSRFNQFELYNNRQAILDRFTEVLVWCGQGKKKLKKN